MSAFRQSPSFNSSIASSQYEGIDDAESTRVKNCVKESLKSRIFLGRYIERRLINQQVGYRDIVVVSAAESELKRDLIDAQQKLRSACSKISWIGITDTDFIGYNPTGGVCICTEIDNQPFGVFWFQIKSLKFREDEIILTLKFLRHITETFLEVEPILTGGTKKYKETLENKVGNDVTLNETYTDIVFTFKSALSITNVKEFFTFLFAFVIAIFTGSTAFVNFLGNFILALIREMSILVKNSTPMFLGVLDFFSKIVGGFYILLAMMFKQKAPMPMPKRSLTHYRSTPRHNAYNYDDDGQFD